MHCMAIGIEKKGLKKNLKAIPGEHSTELIQQLYLEHNTKYGKYCSLKLGACVVGTTVGSRQ
jgi:hypothetical protein